MPSPLESTFVHPPLDISKQQIRLVKFTNDSNLSTSGPILLMRVFEIDQCPNFIALSYTWGPPSPSSFIDIYSFSGLKSPLPFKSSTSYSGLHPHLTFVAGDTHIEFQNDTDLLGSLVHFEKAKFKVRQNLADFLNDAMPHRYLDAWFWIDQLNIDQSNEKEKNHQVQFMCEIFKNATSVLAWLGKTNSVKEAFVFECLDRHYWSKIASRSELSRVVQEIRGRKAISRAERPGTTGDSYADLFCWSLTSFICRRYFKRLWIIQEIVLGKRVEFLCGRFKFHWFDLAVFGYEEFREMVREMDHSTRTERALRSWLMSFYHPLDSQRADLTETRDLYQVLIRFHGKMPDLPTLQPRFLYNCPSLNDWLCENSHDEIYGLMGLVPPEERLVVDYAKSDVKLRKEVWHIIISRRIDQLCAELASSGACDFDQAAAHCLKLEGMADILFGTLKISPKLSMNAAVGKRGISWPPDYNYQKMLEVGSKSRLKVTAWTSEIGRYSKVGSVWPPSCDYRKMWAQGLNKVKWSGSKTFFNMEYWKELSARMFVISPLDEEGWLASWY